MVLNNFTRIEKAVNVSLLKRTHIIGVGAGGAYCLYDSLARTGLGKLTVLDFDSMEEVNITRQGYEGHQVGTKKVLALSEHLARVNSGTIYKGIEDNFLTMGNDELDAIFGNGDLFLFLTDSFEAQAFGNKLALKYKKPAIWAGFYEKSRCAEIVFTIPGVTPACFRCAVSPRYKVHSEMTEEMAFPIGYNTIFHSQFLDAMVGMVAMAILHNDAPGYEFSGWFGSHWDRNLIQIKASPAYGNLEGSLFLRTFGHAKESCFTFNAVWQRIEEERPPKYEACPDCGGTGDLLYPKPANHADTH